MSNKAGFLLLAIAVTFYICNATARIRQSLAQDELHWFIAAKSYLESGAPVQYPNPDRLALWSPHLYLWLTAISMNLLGIAEWAARVPGVISGAISILLVYRLANVVVGPSRDNGTLCGGLCSLVYATTPAVVQGSVIIDIDNAILTPAILCNFISFLSYLRQPSVVHLGLLSIATAGAYWCRVTTPNILLVLFPLFAWLYTGTIRQSLRILGVQLVGLAGFLVTWVLYCQTHSFPAAEPFRYVIGTLCKNREPMSISSAFALLAQNALYLDIWTGIWPFIIALALTIGTVHRIIQSNATHSPLLIDAILGGTLSILIPYSIIGGCTFGFPKYHCPGIALMSVLIATELSRQPSRTNPCVLHWVALGVIPACAHLLLPGDLLYNLRFSLREQLASMPNQFRPVVLQSLFLAGTLVVLTGMNIVLGMRAWNVLGARTIILITVLGTNMGMTTRQTLSDYHTGYNYGSTGTVEVVDYLDKNIPRTSRVVAPSEVLYYLHSSSSPYVSDPTWSSGQELDVSRKG